MPYRQEWKGDRHFLQQSKSQIPEPSQYDGAVWVALSERCGLL